MPSVVVATPEASRHGHGRRSSSSADDIDVARDRFNESRRRRHAAAMDSARVVARNHHALWLIELEERAARGFGFPTAEELARADASPDRQVPTPTTLSPLALLALDTSPAPCEPERAAAEQLPQLPPEAASQQRALQSQLSGGSFEHHSQISASDTASTPFHALGLRLYHTTPSDGDFLSTCGVSPGCRRDQLRECAVLVDSPGAIAVSEVGQWGSLMLEFTVNEESLLRAEINRAERELASAIAAEFCSTGYDIAHCDTCTIERTARIRITNNFLLPRIHLGELTDEEFAALTASGIPPPGSLRDFQSPTKPSAAQAVPDAPSPTMNAPRTDDRGDQPPRSMLAPCMPVRCVVM